MLEKMIVRRALRALLQRGRVNIYWWDGSVHNYAGRQDQNWPVLNVEVRSSKVVRQLIANASLAVGEGFTDGQLVIDESQLPLLFELLAANQPTFRIPQPFRCQRNRQRRQQGYIERHYSVGNDYYGLFLDPTLTYSCAYFVNQADTLERAQQQKIDVLLCKLRLQQGMTLLDIGCGWGHLAVAAAKQYGARVLGITLSSEQLKSAEALAKREGVSHLVRFKLMNYQDITVTERFDRVISVGMFEHVGKGNHDDYFRKVADLLVDGGVSVLHTITQQRPRRATAWIDRNVFPGGYLPTVAEIEAGLARRGLWSVDRENLWLHYAETLRIWRERHRANREQIIKMFDERFYRLRDFWLAGSEGGFRHGQLGLTQVVFTKGKPTATGWPLTRDYLYAQSEK